LNEHLIKKEAHFIVSKIPLHLPCITQGRFISFKITDLFRKIAVTVGEKLKYTYLYDLDKNVMDYLKKVKNLDKGADDLS
jgi:hypothetical protein